MDIRHSVHLLSVSVFAIVALLFVVTVYTISGDMNTVASSAGITATDSSAPAVPVHPGKKVWKDNGCEGCHAKDMRTDATGPALSGVTARWSGYPEADLYAWIRNSGKLVASGHPRATELIAKWKRPMNAYPNMTDEEIGDLLGFIEGK